MRIWRRRPRRKLPFAVRQRKRRQCRKLLFRLMRQEQRRRMQRKNGGLKTDKRADTAEEEVPEQGPVNMTVIVNRYPVICSGKSSYVFVDVFSFIDFDLNASAGRAIVTRLNGRNAEYMEPLKDGDVIEIYWEELNS